MEKNQLFSAARLHCRCVVSEETERFSNMLDRAEKLLNNGKTKQAVNAMQHALTNLKDLHKQHIQFKSDYARDIVEQVKTRAFNVGANQSKLQTVPHVSGKEKRELDRQKDEAKKNKRRKKTIK